MLLVSKIQRINTHTLQDICARGNCFCNKPTPGDKELREWRLNKKNREKEKRARCNLPK